jgi:hypothetical protein
VPCAVIVGVVLTALIGGLVVLVVL